MKIIGENFDTEDNILKLISKSTPSSDAKLTFTNFSEMAGWVYVNGKVNESEFSIHFSSWVSDTSIFIHFFEELINLKDEITLFLDNEGSYPLLYAKKVDNDTLRFVFAHDYILHKNDEDYEDCLRYKIEFDLLVSKKELLSCFYIILYLFLNDYSTNYADYIKFDLEHANKYMNEIKTYIDEYLTSEEKERIENKIKEGEAEELGEWTKEMLKPENLIGPYKSIDELIQETWYDEDNDEEEE